MIPPSTSACLGRILDDVGCSHAGVDVEAGDAPGVVVVEHQPRALLVGVVEGHLAVGGIAVVIHIRHGPHAGTLRVIRVLAGRRNPLVRRAVRDPGRDAAVQVDDGPVVGEAETLRHQRILAGTAAHRILRVDLVRVHHRPLVAGRGHA